ncbi:hypothetical protein DET54_106297 [Paenibacillus pabuli]|uniref:Uncharacterized protein n=1 Tax=Paenibacillus pabuli TaxID=1472 RepID=A0ABX9BKI7_9BACL|nr:hypothetical protein [Paenibacillus pabuli]RAI96937.1 hypothetical protein DET54_106297 [Paenibacillus pabuli]
MSSYMEQVDWIYKKVITSHSVGLEEKGRNQYFFAQLLNGLDQQSDWEQERQPQLFESRHLRHADKMVHWIEDHYIDEIK